MVSSQFMLGFQYSIALRRTPNKHIGNKELTKHTSQIRPVKCKAARTHGIASTGTATLERRPRQLLRGTQSCPGDEARSRMDPEAREVSESHRTTFLFPRVLGGGRHRSWIPLRLGLGFRRVPPSTGLLALARSFPCCESKPLVQID